MENKTMTAGKNAFNENNIELYLHCGKCIKEYQSDESLRKTISPKDYARIQAGWTKQGLQVWCNRHDCNIIHIDFERTKHKADTTALEKK